LGGAAINQMEERFHGETRAEQEALRAAGLHADGTFEEFSAAEVESSIPARFEKIVRAHSERPAAKNGARVLRYDELNRAANRIARAIHRERGAGVEPVALLYADPLKGLAACLGILKAGKILVVVDPSFPLDKLRGMVEFVRPAAIVTERSHLRLAESLAERRPMLIDVDGLAADLEALLREP